MASKESPAAEGELSSAGIIKTGLSSAEVQQRLQQFGFNDIPEKKVRPLRKFLGYFWGQSRG